jgi:hypothetical protein
MVQLINSLGALLGAPFFVDLGCPLFFYNLFLLLVDHLPLRHPLLPGTPCGAILDLYERTFSLKNKNKSYVLLHSSSSSSSPVFLTTQNTYRLQGLGVSCGRMEG